MNDTNTLDTSPPAWLVQEISRGFRRLLTLGLEGQPASELITGTVAVWAERIALRQLVPEDAPRIRTAFGKLSELRTWPKLPDFWSAMPVREPSGPALPRLSSADREANIRKLCAMVDELIAKKTPDLPEAQP